MKKSTNSDSRGEGSPTALIIGLLTTLAVVVSIGPLTRWGSRSAGGPSTASLQAIPRKQDGIEPGVATDGLLSSEQAIAIAAGGGKDGIGQTLSTARSVQGFLKMQPTPPPETVYVGPAPGVVFWDLVFAEVCVEPSPSGPCDTNTVEVYVDARTGEIYGVGGFIPPIVP